VPANAFARLARTRASGALLLALLLAVWQSSGHAMASPNWPPVSEIAKALAAGVASGELIQIFSSSLYRMLVGYGIGVAAALVVGLLMASTRLVHAALEPVVELLRPIPVPAIVPPLILLLGVDDALKIFIVAFSGFFPVLVNTIAGVRAVDPIGVNVARTLGVGRFRTALRVVLPASLPYVLAGMRVSLSLALIVTVVAEMIAGSSGIGYYILTMQYALRASDMYAAIFVLAAVGYGLNRGFVAIERRVLHWYY
jgi:ABC-type nitrate/sulfonate/bicarbonate transport system permease component